MNPIPINGLNSMTYLSFVQEGLGLEISDKLLGRELEFVEEVRIGQYVFQLFAADVSDDLSLHVHNGNSSDFLVIIRMIVNKLTKRTRLYFIKVYLRKCSSA